MTRKHFQIVASAIRNLQAQGMTLEQVQIVAAGVGRELHQTNPRNVYVSHSAAIPLTAKLTGTHCDTTMLVDM